MTSWSGVISDSAMLFIDDVRLTEELEVCPALFYRRMAFYVTNALPMVNRPPELYAYIKSGLIEPEFDSYDWVSTEESLEDVTVVDTGKVGYELFSCVIREIDASGNVSLYPYTEAEYNPETGEVTFPVQENIDVEYGIDFYKDGEFPELSPSMVRLIGLAVACVWDERFSRNWLNIQMKIQDETFKHINESNYIDKVQARLMANRQTFSDELRKYEQDCAYTNTVSRVMQRPRLI